MGEEAGEADNTPRRPIVARERIEYWSLVAEIVAAFAIVVSLIFVGLQLRDANRVALRDESNATVEQNSRFRLSVYENREVAELLVKGVTAPETLDFPDRLRFNAAVAELMGNNRQVWDRWQEGMIDTEQFEGATRPLLDVICSSGGRLAWEAGKYGLPRAYFEAVEERIPAYEKTLGRRCGSALTEEDRKRLGLDSSD